MTVKATLNRTFYDVDVGDVLLGDWPAIGIDGKPLRVLEIDDGQLADGRIVVNLIEDIYPYAEWLPVPLEEM